MIDNRKKYSHQKLAHKLYLSEDTRGALESESKRLNLPMSSVVDLLIRQHLIEDKRDDRRRRA
jgi:hypothetical protein